MESKKVVLDDQLGTLSGYQFRELLTDVADSFDLDNEHITTIRSYEANLYVGTSKGKILHYHLFEDAPSYILITQLSILDEPVTKMIILPQTQRALILAGGTATLYSLPELTPSNIGKIRDAHDILLLSYSVHATTQSRAPVQNDKIIAFTPQKIRILQVGPDQIKLLKDVNYSKAIKGISTASAMSSNYSNLVLVANDSHYDIIDLKHTRKIPLFEYSNGSNRNVNPYIIPFNAEDKEEEEYLLTISSDETTSMSMFINPLGDVTRGTITWIEEGYPSGGVVIEWPYVVGLFSSSKDKNKLIFSSLETFEVVASTSLDQKQPDNMTNEDRSVTEFHAPGLELNHQELQQDNADLNKIDDKDPLSKEEENLKDDTTKLDVSKNAESDQESLSIPNTELNKETDTIEKQITDEVTLTSKDIEPKASNSEMNDTTTDSLQVCKVTQIKLDNQSLNDKLSRINLLTKERELPGISEVDKGSILIYSKSKVWLTYQLHQIDEILILFHKALLSSTTNEFSKALQSTFDSFKGLKHDFLLYLLIICDFLDENYDNTLKYLTRIKGGELIISPLFVVHFLSTAELKGSDNFLIFKGILEICDGVKFKKSDAFVASYLSEVYPDLVKNDKTSCQVIRTLFYVQFSDLKQAYDFFKNNDQDNWMELDSTNNEIIKILQGKSISPILYVIYEKLLAVSSANVPEIIESYCSMCLELLSGDIIILEQLNITKDQLIDKILGQLQKNIENENAYSKYLLEVLKIDSERSFQYLKKHKNSKFKDTHKRIMDEISHSHTNELDFSLLRIEYLEGSWIDSNYKIEESKELISELIKVLISPTVLSNENRINFEILLATFKVENSLQETKWPKLEWIDYVHLNLNRNEAKELLKLYLKVFELLYHMKSNGWNIENYLEDLSNIEGRLFDYLTYLTPKNTESIIDLLLEFHDFSCAEHFAIHGSLPFSSHSLYFKDSSFIKSKETSFTSGAIKSNLQRILDHYIREDEADSLNIACIRHFACTYGYSIFSPTEMLNLLPQDIPVIHLLQYLEGVIIDLKAQNREGIVKKALSKADSAFTSKLYKDLSL
ncbi:uncharacterized protein CANTADRAFT_10435 [Suhomyces tanzawaensis NRRL Y-17324]|uniref:CNH domain-containing protein n=1 Tax=Suhomyces tanzawaensis NRRL Y-17324 TaxID=984487 RepID=A0A1E4SJ72_9ASCO|nr:uncharacterized protein CANTADRAFT_10435 [Suhomyces tanzawaensis NRRL Y-17324]ODV79551.1 hypothetical protein CANTADRAFT_10435 [Suhomyces tanzawaensis NRRL Y-17324]